MQQNLFTLKRVGFAVLWAAAGATLLARACEETDARVRKLIEKLASANQAPPKRDGSPHSYERMPADYDLVAQKAVFDAADEILKIGEKAIPELLRHTHDKRYSVTQLSGTGATHNYSVGQECQRLVRLMVSAGVVPLWTWRGSPEEYLSKDLPSWWKKNGKRPLWELQLEQLDNFVRANKHILESNAPPREFGPSREQLREITEAAEASAEKLKKTHEPLPITYPRRAMIFKKGQ